MNPAAPASSLSTAHSLGSAALNLVIVLALIFALAWVLRRVRGLRSNLPGQISIKATLSLSMKERVVLIDAAGEHLLIGVSPSGITKLHRYTKPLQEVSIPENQFSNLLRRLNHVKERGDA
ncbi:MAG TPA: flagellar biosynthetic protein FliO [Rudaea sp.]|nr:flagellar biosynthetic protein FliO [Rudaea sp.]